MNRDWWAGVFCGVGLVIIFAMLYGIAVVSSRDGHFEFMCFKEGLTYERPAAP